VIWRLFTFLVKAWDQQAMTIVVFRDPMWLIASQDPVVCPMSPSSSFYLPAGFNLLSSRNESKSIFTVLIKVFPPLHFPLACCGK
jgi:hypothetical protein